jgi:hypothetical protein
MILLLDNRLLAHNLLLGTVPRFPLKKWEPVADCTCEF